MPRHQNGGRGGRGQSSVPYHVRKTTLLPSSLKDELVSLGKLDAPASSRAGGAASTSVLGRKQRRRDDRQKQQQQQQQQQSHSLPSKQPSLVDVKGKGKQRAAAVEQQQPVAKEAPRPSSSTQESNPAATAARKRKKGSSNKDGDNAEGLASTSQRTKVAPDHRTPLQRLLEKADPSTSSSRGAKGKGRAAANPSGVRSAKEEEEDAEIAWLEYKLGAGKSKEMQEDGLDDLLDDLDQLDEDLFGEGESGSEQDGLDSAEEDDDDEMAEEDIDMVENDGSGNEDDEKIMSEAELSDFHTEDEDDGEWGGIADEEQAAQQKASGESPAHEEAVVGDSTASALATRYIPPALRRQQEAGAAAAAAASASSASAPTEPVHDPRLRRQLLGLLNRLSPTSFPTLILHPTDPTSLHSIYLAHPRASINVLLVSLIIEIVSASGEGIGETQVVVLAGLAKLLSTGIVGGMAASGGKELAATLVDRVIRDLDAETETGRENADKKRLNLVVFLAEMYNLQVIAAGLVFDLVKEFISNGLKEADVEALLRILKVSGTQLRHDDPTALKQIIQLVQGQQSGIDAKSQSSRTRFMIETLTNLRNNKMKPATGVAADAEANLKRFITNLAKKSSAPNEPLRISLQDLRSASTKGKWWLVGAAWSGNPLVDKQAEFQDVNSQSRQLKVGDAASATSKEAMLLRLAKKQGMNTDIRRKIFVAIMSSEDYVDAVDRLLSLNLTEVQQREVVRVILHCLGSEKAYNPFYTLILARLLTSSSTQATHSYQITLQYALWDHFRALGESDVGGAEMVKSAAAGTGPPDEKKNRNIAKAYAWWCAKAGLGLTILKPLSFHSLLPASRSFLSHLLASLFLSTQTASPLLVVPASLASASERDSAPLETIFMQLATSNRGLAQGVAWFLDNSREMRKECSKSEVVQWAKEAVLEMVGTGGDFGL